MDADVNFIVLSVENHIEMLEQLFGAPDKDKPGPGKSQPRDKWELPPRETPIKLTSEIFDKMFPGERPSQIKVK